jgi:hypothetical protein
VCWHGDHHLELTKQLLASLPRQACCSHVSKAIPTLSFRYRVLQNHSRYCLTAVIAEKAGTSSATFALKFDQRRAERGMAFVLLGQKAG